MKTRAERPAIEVAIEIEAPIDSVWKALTDAEELVRWFPLEAGENPDGSVWMSWGGDFRFRGRVGESEPPHRIRFLYPQPTPGSGELVEIATEYRLESRGGKTALRIVQSGFSGGAEWEDQYDATRTGWEVELRGLRHYLENHRGRDRIVGWAKAAYASSRENAWKRLMSSEGLLAEGALEALSEGSPYRIRAANGDLFEGVVLFFDPPRNFVATVESLGNALLKVRLEDLYGLREAHVWLSAYRLPAKDVEAFRQKWQAELDRIFGG